jgi:hypothetical protein
MKRCNFTLSPAYVASNAASVPVEIASDAIPAWTLLTAVMLAGTVFGMIWFG